MKIDFKYLEDNGYNSVTDYCRVLVKQEDFPKTIYIYRDEMLCLTVDTEKAALLDVKEGKGEGPIFVKYKDKKMSEETKAKLSLKRPKKGVRADRTLV